MNRAEEATLDWALTHYASAFLHEHLPAGNDSRCSGPVQLRSAGAHV
jgi:hypothetical protein